MLNVQKLNLEPANEVLNERGRERDLLGIRESGIEGQPGSQVTSILRLHYVHVG